MGLSEATGKLGALVAQLRSGYARHALGLHEVLTQQQLVKLYLTSYPWLPRCACIASAVAQWEGAVEHAPAAAAGAAAPSG